MTEAIPAAKPATPEAEKSSPTSPADTTDDPATPAADVGAVAETPPLTDIVDFKALPFEHPATSMAMTEDGRYLVVSHQTADQLTLYDVLNQRVAAKVATTAPRCVLCRGNKIFVSNFGQGTVSVFANRERWQLVNQLKVLKPNIMHMSAPGGRNFSDLLLITCHGEGLEASYRDSQVLALDTATDNCRLVSNAAVASASYDGRLVMTQGSFRLSPAGNLVAFNFKEYLSVGDTAEPVLRGGNSQTPYVYQVASGDCWIGNDIVFGSVPLTTLREGLGKLIVPDLSQYVLYALTVNNMSAYRLNGAFTELGIREAKFPVTEDDFHEVYHQLYRMRDYMLDHPVAYTHGDKLSLFVLTATGGTILAAQTRAVVANAATTASSADSSPAKRPPSTDKSDPVMPAPEVGTSDGLLERFPHVKLGVDPYTLLYGHKLERVLLLQGNTLRELIDDGLTVANTLTLPSHYDFLEERRATYIAVAGTPEPVLHVIDKDSLKVLREIRLQTSEIRVLEITDLAIAPTDNRSFVAVKHSEDVPRFTVLEVNEETGSVQSPGILGTWVEVSPDSQFLYTGYRDVFARGHRFHVHPDLEGIEIPAHGNVDMLMSWSPHTKPLLRQVIQLAGGNGNGIRLSPDGKRITYLSQDGSPAHSKNLAVWKTDYLVGTPEYYVTENRAVTTELAFHPTLPLAAVPGSGSAVLFQRDSGERLEDRLSLDADGLGNVQVERLFFSPNGRNLVFLCATGAAGRYLRAVPLKLSLDEWHGYFPFRPQDINASN
jgi:hypothetical protein